MARSASGDEAGRMTNLSLAQLSAGQLVVMADGLLRAGDTKTARTLYRAALPKAPADMRDRIRVRIGLATQKDRRLVPTFEVLTAVEKLGGQGFFVGDGLATWLKTVPFLEDARFMEIADRHTDLLPIRNWHWNLMVAAWAVQRARALDGDLVELGVFKGHTTLFCAEYLGFADWPKRWWLYDTFEGIPDDQVDPAFAVSNKEAYNAGSFSFEEVRTRFAAFPNIDVIKGRVPEVLAERSPPRIAFLHVDLNNVAAEIAALDILFDRVTPGGVILFDDFGWAVSRAQYDAEVAWFAARGEQILPLPTGQGLYIKR